MMAVIAESLSGCETSGVPPAPGAGGAVLLEQEAGSGGLKVARETDDFSLYNYYHDLFT